jgi:hypothetical protein
MSDQQHRWGDIVSEAMRTLVVHLMEDGDVLVNPDKGTALCWCLTQEEWREVYLAAARIADLAPLMRHRLGETLAKTQGPPCE